MTGPQPGSSAKFLTRSVEGKKERINFVLAQFPKQRRLRRTVKRTIDEIVRRNTNIAESWGDAFGWAPDDAAEILAKSRLDRQVELSRCLRFWRRKPRTGETEGALILAYANLGSLLESSMKLLLCVYLQNYAETPVIRWNKPVDPDALDLESVRQFYVQNIWDEPERQKWEPWILKVQQRRNAIHSFKHKEIGTRKEFLRDLRTYIDFLDEIESRVPWPDRSY